MKYSLLKHLFVFVATLLVATPLRPQNVSIMATVDRTQIGLNEDFTLSVEISGDAGEAKLPNTDAFAALVGTSTSQNIQFINGRLSSSKTYHYTFIARTVGKFTIEPVEVEAKGQTYRSQPIQIEIVQIPQSGTPAPQTPPSGAPGRSQRSEPPPNLEGNLYLDAQVDRRRVFQNEPVVVRYKIYTRLTISSYGFSRLPDFGGFWAEDFPVPKQPQTYQEVINGQRYLVAEIKKTALFPQSPGKKVLEPLEVECEVQLPARRRSRDPFEAFFDDPFFARTTRQAIASRPVEIEVLPLPTEGRPVNFSGAVGTFSLSASLDRAETKTNEAVTLKVKASGAGNIKILPEPKLELPNDFEVYDPKVAEDVNHNNDQISGSKTWEYVIVPRFPGVHEIKPITLSYFDPRAKTYRVTTTAALSLNVEKGNTDYVAVGGGLSKEDVKLLGQDIRFISKVSLPFRDRGDVLYTNTFFLAALLAPLAALFVAFVYRRHQEKLGSNIAYARSRKASSVAQKHLHAAKKLAHKNDEKAFYAEVQRALLSFLGNKLNIAEAGIITDDVERLLQEKQVDADIIRAYIDCLSTCDFQRFAPAQTNGKAMQDFYEHARRAIEAMERAL